VKLKWKSYGDTGRTAIGDQGRWRIVTEGVWWHLTVQPAPLEPRENRGKFAAGSAIKTHCPHDHEYTPENTTWVKGRGTPVKVCKTCTKAARAKRIEREKQLRRTDSEWAERRRKRDRERAREAAARKRGAA